MVDEMILKGNSKLDCIRVVKKQIFQGKTLSENNCIKENIV